jgi:hypothetical protein
MKMQKQKESTKIITAISVDEYNMKTNETRLRRNIIYSLCFAAYLE